MPRLRRWAKRLGLGLLELFVVLTIVSLVYNAATADGVRPATALYAGPFVRVDGKAVAYRRWGTHGTPIILLGGFVVPSSVWNGVGKLLGRDHRVFALDLPPFGYSERKGPYTLRGWIEILPAFETRFGLQRPVLVGHSLGAAVGVAHRERAWAGALGGAGPGRFRSRRTQIGAGARGAVPPACGRRAPLHACRSQCDRTRGRFIRATLRGCRTQKLCPSLYLGE